MIWYIFIFAIITVGLSIYYLTTKSLIALRLMKIFGSFLAILVIILVFVIFYIDDEDEMFIKYLNGHEVKKEIENYLEAHIVSASFGGKIFCSYEFLGALGIDDRTEIYAWVVCEEYYLKGDTLWEGTGTSMPVAVILRDNIATEHKEPRAGSLYQQDIKSVFPKNIQKKISKNDSIHSLLSENRSKAQMKFKIN